MLSNLRKFAAEFRACWALTIEYRMSIFIWMLSMMLPFVMMAGWLSIARDGPVGRFSYGDFIAYYVAAIVVRNVTGVWIVWEMDNDLRLGEMSFKLLKPMNPILHYMASSLAPKPLRLLVLVPILIAVKIFLPDVQFVTDPVALAVFLLSIAGAWAMMFFQLYSIGLLGFWITQPSSLHDVWFGIFSLFSGYLVPLDLFPGVIRELLYAMPFRYHMSFSIEILTGRLNLTSMAQGLVLQWIWVAVFYGVYRFVWWRGVRRFSAVGA